MLCALKLHRRELGQIGDAIDRRPAGTASIRLGNVSAHRAIRDE